MVLVWYDEDNTRSIEGYMFYIPMIKMSVTVIGSEWSHCDNTRHLRTHKYAENDDVNN